MTSQAWSAFQPSRHLPHSLTGALLLLVRKGLTILQEGINLEEQVRENLQRNRTALHRSRVPAYPGLWRHADTEIRELRRLARQLRVLWEDYGKVRALIPHLLPAPPPGRPATTRHFTRRYFHQLSLRVKEAVRTLILRKPFVELKSSTVKTLWSSPCASTSPKTSSVCE